jgi:hypothetical protein
LNNKKQSNMKKWKVSYAPSYDLEDLCHVWVHGENQDEAKENVKREYHDIGRIIQIVPL